MNDFEKWLERNKHVLATHTFEEIADLAIACGFQRPDVSAWLTKETFRRVA